MPTDSNIKASILDRFKITCLSTFFSTICFSILFFQKRQNLFKSGIILIYFGLKIDFPLTLSFTFIFFEDLCLLGCFLYDKGKEILLHQNKVQSSLKAESPIQWAENLHSSSLQCLVLEAMGRQTRISWGASRETLVWSVLICCFEVCLVSPR